MFGLEPDLCDAMYMSRYHLVVIAALAVGLLLFIGLIRWVAAEADAACQDPESIQMTALCDAQAD